MLKRIDHRVSDYLDDLEFFFLAKIFVRAKMVVYQDFRKTLVDNNSMLSLSKLIFDT